MKLLAFVFFSVSILGCMAQQKPPQVMKGLEVITVLDIHDLDLNPYAIQRKFFVVEKDSINIYTIPTFELFGKTKKDDFGGLVTELDSVEYHYYHVIFETGQKFGYTCDSLGRDWKKIPLDSFLASNSVYALDTLVNSLGENSSLVSSKISGDGEELTENYATKTKPDFKTSDSTNAVYNRKLNHYRFSFSRRADQAKQRKLCRFEKVFNADPAGEYMFLREKRYYIFEMKEVDIPKPEIMDKLVSMYYDLEKNKSGH